MKLFYVPKTRANRVRWLLEELAVPYTLVRLDAAKGDTHAPEHLARHPLGHVPVLETTNGTLYESAAIALHVADLHGRFIPPVGTQERGLVYQWLFFAMTELEPHCVTFFAEKVHRKTPDSELAQKAKQKLGEAVKVLNAAVEGREFLVGDTFTVADVIVTAVAWWANRMGAVEQAPALVSYVERMTARPAWKRATQD